METKRTPLSILMFWAHVADAACEGAGTMALHADLGDRVTGVICSDGERHHPDLFLDAGEAPGRLEEIPFLQATLEEMKEFKRREAKRVGEILGLSEVICLGWDDDRFSVTYEGARQLADIILRVKPDIVVTHLPSQMHAQTNTHAFVGQMTLRALGIAGSRIRQVDGIPAHHVKEVFYLPMGGEIADSRDSLCEGIVCDTWIDITPVVDRKVRAIDQIVSQSYQGKMARKVVESREGRWGMLAGCSYAEPFLSARGHTFRALPLLEADLTKQFTPNDLPGAELSAHNVPLATAADAFKLKP